jgi:small GTP-binding protein
MSSSLEAKIVVLGAQGVGKTSLVNRYVNASFQPHVAPASTIGASFLTKRVLDTDSDTVVRLQIWDTAGQERFRSISRLYYRGANACILCYSITDEESFREMARWMQDLRKELGEGIVLHVVGTKADLVAADPSKRAVPFERCIAYVAENLYPTLSSTPPATAGHSNLSSSAGSSGKENNIAGVSAAAQYNRMLLAKNADNSHTQSTSDALLSPSSKRSSGFWGQDIGWDCCHEISAESGEGVEEVFRVVTRKLVEQARKAASVGTPVSWSTIVGGITPGTVGPDSGYFDGAHGQGRGSFRVGRDRRSWLGFPPGVVIEETLDGNVDSVTGKRSLKRCCY